METPISNVFVDIHVDNQTYRAAMCPRCGTKIYPANLLQAHLERHRRRDLALEEELRKLQLVMGRMR
ncbi:MAG TPA: hypothetical protein VGR30_20175 [Candidatus Binatia bacterium]|nr:hypothetical protein [Candidatus Binatia bacterium]